ncbi:uncharacterized protein LOC144120009 [Amblyomma americanum]
MAYPPPFGLGSSQGPPRNVGFGASESGYPSTNEVRLGPQVPGAPHTLSPPGMNPGVCSPSGVVAPYPPAGANQDIYLDSSSRISSPGTNMSPGFLNADDRNSPPPPGVRGLECNEYLPASPNSPPVNYQRTHEAAPTPVPGSTTAIPTTSSGMVYVSSSAEDLSPPCGFGPEQSRYYSVSQNYPPVQQQPRHGVSATPLPGLATGCPTAFTGLGDTVSSAEALPSSSPPSAFGPERGGYYPESSKNAPVRNQPRHGVSAMPAPGLATVSPTPSLGMLNSFPSMEVLPPTQPACVIGPEGRGYPPKSSTYPLVHDQPRQGASSKPRKQFSPACRSSSDTDTSHAEPGRFRSDFSSPPSTLAFL